MPARGGAAGRGTPRRHAVTLDVVALTPHQGELAVLMRRRPAGSRARWEIPWAPLGSVESLDAAAARLTRTALGAAPSHLEQVGAFGDTRRHPAGVMLSVAFFALAPSGVAPPVHGETAWFPASSRPALNARQSAMVDGALAALRLRMHQAPLAFRLLPPTFTLTELQQIYEILRGQSLHKASFRRSLLTAGIVEPTDEWRSEGRGRPAQLFRQATRKRRLERK